MIFNSDSTFERYVGVSNNNEENHKGTYFIKYSLDGDYVLLKYKNGESICIRCSKDELIYRTYLKGDPKTHDDHPENFDEHYIKVD